MPSQLIPAIPEGIDDSFSRLDISADFHLDESEFTQFRGAVPIENGAAHATIRRRVRDAPTLLEFFGVIGVHDYRNDTKRLEEQRSIDSDTTGMSLHYGLQLRSRQVIREKDDENWDRLAVLARQLVPPHAARVQYRLGLEASLALPAVKLPILLSTPEVSGFSQINGVRLVQVDTTTPEQELYSLIIDLHGSRLDVDVSTRVELRFDERLVETAVSRAASIAKLGVERTTKQ